jgi:3-methyl-2-oxobutanoate hydroxymethyltransferase
VLLECVPAACAAEITQMLRVPTIGIGAGAGCDGQILVINDLVGLTPGRLPRHARAYADLKQSIADAVARYCLDVREGKFPGAEQSFA